MNVGNLIIANTQIDAVKHAMTTVHHLDMPNVVEADQMITELYKLINAAQDAIEALGKVGN